MHLLLNWLIFYLSITCLVGIFDLFVAYWREVAIVELAPLLVSFGNFPPAGRVGHTLLFGGLLQWYEFRNFAITCYNLLSNPKLLISFA